MIDMYLDRIKFILVIRNIHSTNKYCNKIILEIIIICLQT